MPRSLSFGILQKSMIILKAPVELHDKTKMLHLTNKPRMRFMHLRQLSLNSLYHVIIDSLQQEIQYCIKSNKLWGVGHPRPKFWGVGHPRPPTVAAPMTPTRRNSLVLSRRRCKLGIPDTRFPRRPLPLTSTRISVPEPR